MERIFFFGRGGKGGGGEWGGAKGGEGLGLVAALQMEIERRPANQDEIAFLQIQGSENLSLFAAKRKEDKEECSCSRVMNRIPRC